MAAVDLSIVPEEHRDLVRGDRLGVRHNGASSVRCHGRLVRRAHVSS